jgi:hypothetical protein
MDMKDEDGMPLLTWRVILGVIILCPIVYVAVVYVLTMGKA